MSYCVNCGVELAASEKSCPLCSTPVFNPADSKPKSSYRPHPKKVESIIKDADRKYMVLLATIFLLVPIVITLLIDWFSTGRISWSAYVFNSAILAYVYVLFPLWFKQPSFLFCLIIDYGITAWFLKIIEALSGGAWFWQLGFPLVTLLAAMVFIYSVVNAHLRFGVLVGIGTMLLLVAGGLIFVELIIDNAIDHRVFLTWSFYAAVPCLALGLCALILHRRQRLKDKIKRKFFF